MRRSTVALLGGIATAGAVVGFALSDVGAGSHHSLNASLVAATPSPTGNSAGRAFHPNENAAHEKGESASREAAENSGKFPAGAFQPNENANHEQGESAGREAQENAGKAPTTP